MVKNKRIDIRLNSKDYAVISRKAELCKMTISEYLREAGLNRKVAGFKLSDLDENHEPIKGQLTLEDVHTGVHTEEQEVPPKKRTRRKKASSQTPTGK